MSEPIQLDPMVFKELHVALLQQQLTRYQIEEAARRAQEAVALACAKAGLDPSKQYRLDSASGTATPVGE